MFLISIAHVLSSLWQLITGKVKVGLYFFLTADILTKVLQKCFLSSPLPNIWILFKLLNLIGCHGNRKAKFLNKNQLRSHKGNKAGTLQKCSLDCLYKNNVFCCCWSCVFISLATRCPLAYNGKKEIGHCYLTVDIFEKSFYRNVSFFNCCHGNWKAKCWLKAFIAVYSGERVWPMGLWFIMMTKWQGMKFYVFSHI